MQNNLELLKHIKFNLKHLNYLCQHKFKDNKVLKYLIKLKEIL